MNRLRAARSAADRRPTTGPGLLWVGGGLVVLVGAAALALVLGPMSLPLRGVVLELLDRLPGVTAQSDLLATQAAVVTRIRAPRVVLSMVVGACLSTAGAAYQGVFRNSLADPYLLGVAAGAGLGVTIVTVAGVGATVGPVGAVPLAAFVGSLLAVGLAYVLGPGSDRRRSTSSLILAGVAVAALFSAVQTFLLQRDEDNLRDVYAWLLGRLNTASWDDVWLLAPYAVVSTVVLLRAGRLLDVLAVGDTEAEGLGAHPQRIRLVVVLAASLGTAAAVAVSGLIGFVGIIVPHAVRLLVGTSYRRILPMSMLLGGAFLCMADLVARTALAPAEVPIGVITAFIGAPFFLLILRTGRTS